MYFNYYRLSFISFLEAHIRNENIKQLPSKRLLYNLHICSDLFQLYPYRLHFALVAECYAAVYWKVRSGIIRTGRSVASIATTVDIITICILIDAIVVLIDAAAQRR